MTVQSVCIYCGSSNHVDAAYKEIAKDIGKSFAERGLHIIYGGGHVGLMGLMADAALEAGGKVVGIIPEHIRSHEIQHTGLTELIVVDSMHERKSLMAEKADAFVVLPGGFGTLEEAFEILTWKQLALHNKPIVIYNVNGFWTPLLNLIEYLIENGFAPKTNRTIFKVAQDKDQLFAHLLEPAERSRDPDEKWA